MWDMFTGLPGLFLITFAACLAAISFVYRQKATLDKASRLEHKLDQLEKRIGAIEHNSKLKAQK